MKKILFILLMLSFGAKAQKSSSKLYKGTIDSKPVTLYLKENENPCGGFENYMAIYRYGKNTPWIQLLPETDGKGNFTMPEFRFTGVMILQKTSNGMQGIWISPDGKRQLKVILNVQPLPKQQKDVMEDALEKTNYGNYDC
ncbi:hypothetical protein [Pedobacter nototheniae]|uniref:hypothetical protein n=1 Tax=Pedobacter nototheniae TaxID=2488994 RepID=UPI0029307BAF|nr:hypothetical protein [Pedobacter nototheniae]